MPGPSHPCALSPQQIRKLRRELESSQEKVATLTSQLSANVSPHGNPVGHPFPSLQGVGQLLDGPMGALISPSAFRIPHLAAGAHLSVGVHPNVGAHLFLHFSQANLVAAFEQSLVSMTSRLRHLAETAEEKVGAQCFWGVLDLGDCAKGALGMGSAPSGCTPRLPTLLPQDTELLDLRETIDFLKKKNSEAQAVIQGALNGTDVTPKGKA